MKEKFNYQAVFRFFCATDSTIERIIFVGDTTDNPVDLLPYLDEVAQFHLGSFKKEFKYSYVLESFNYSSVNLNENVTKKE